VNILLYVNRMATDCVIPKQVQLDPKVKLGIQGLVEYLYILNFFKSNIFSLF
jgi:hypothetical protein